MSYTDPEEGQASSLDLGGMSYHSHADRLMYFENGGAWHVNGSGPFKIAMLVYKCNEGAHPNFFPPPIFIVRLYEKDEPRAASNLSHRGVASAHAA